MEKLLELHLTERRRYWQNVLTDKESVPMQSVNKIEVLICEQGKTEFVKDEKLSRENKDDFILLPILTLSHAEIELNNLEIYSISYYPNLQQLTIWANRKAVQS